MLLKLKREMKRGHNCMQAPKESLHAVGYLIMPVYGTFSFKGYSMLCSEEGTAQAEKALSRQFCSFLQSWGNMSFWSPSITTLLPTEVSPVLLVDT